MSKKNKSKKTNNNQSSSNVQQSKCAENPILTEELKSEIDNSAKEVASIEPIETLSTESENKQKECEEKNDLIKYWEFVKGIHKRYEYLLKVTDEEKEKTTQINQELEDLKKDFQDKQKELKQKTDECNKKDKEITEREFALDNGEYTGVIKRLLDTIKDTEKKVFTDTENLLKELFEFHKKNLANFSEQIEEKSETEKQLAKLKKEKKKFEVEKQFYEEEIEERYKEQYADSLKEKEASLDRLQHKVEKLENDNAKFKELYENLQSAFGSITPEQILVHQSLLNDELKRLKNELNERPEKFELDSKQEKIEELQSKITEYQSKINEAELLELKRILNNNDKYIIEINNYKSQIESANVREKSLRKTVEDLSQTIDQLKGESDKKTVAFEFAKKCDADKKHYGKKHLGVNAKPLSDLKMLANFVQQRMAFNPDKHFYYDLETIRIFLAGLHMSPISILQGISGTGKTSLPREFAKALLSDPNYVGLDSDNQNNAPYRICAVQSGWRDSMDLMGYYNSFEHKYKETDFFKALYEANQPKYSDALFLIILDEMNLSRPEHYFADFLSLLEQSPSERYINLANTPKEVLPELVIGGKLKIPENVRFIGTANHDETTLEFAPKTYDRSNLMEMPKNYTKVEETQIPIEPLNITYSWLNREFEKAEKGNEEAFEMFQDFINSDNIKLLLMDKGIGVGNRLEYQAEKFISVFVESGNNKEKDIATAVDHLITSRLFRTLKNRYDLDKNNLTSFKEDYKKCFTEKFSVNPKFAINLLDNELSKK